eukprot:244118-Pyramimonas_sp.AAC.1
MSEIHFAPPGDPAAAATRAFTCEELRRQYDVAQAVISGIRSELPKAEARISALRKCYQINN